VSEKQRLGVHRAGLTQLARRLKHREGMTPAVAPEAPHAPARLPMRRPVAPALATTPSTYDAGDTGTP